MRTSMPGTTSSDQSSGRMMGPVEGSDSGGTGGSGACVTEVTEGGREGDAVDEGKYSGGGDGLGAGGEGAVGGTDDESRCASASSSGAAAGAGEWNVISVGMTTPGCCSFLPGEPPPPIPPYGPVEEDGPLLPTPGSDSGDSEGAVLAT